MTELQIAEAEKAVQKSEEKGRPVMGILLLLAWGHLVTDMAQGALPALLPVLKQVFALNYAQTSLLVLVSNVASSVIQPIFGLFADRRPARWLLPVGCLVAGVGLAVTGRLPVFGWLLLAVGISSLGVAAYHPEGSRVANLASGVRKGSGMAVFSVGGNLGFGLGSIYMAWLLAVGGHRATVYFIIPAVLMVLALVYYWPRLTSLREEKKGPGAAQKEKGADCPAGGRVAADSAPRTEKSVLAAFALLIVYITFRTWLHAGLYTYIPLYYTDHLHVNAHTAGYIVSIYLLAGAVGTLFGGPLTDVLGAPRVMAGSMALLIPLLYIFRHTGGVVSLVVLAFTGAALISTFSTTIIMGQELLPARKGLASGFTIGFGVGMGGVGVTLLGVLADHLGLPAVFAALNIVAVAGLLLALILSRRYPRRVRG